MLRHEFLNIDDPVYVTDNVYVKNGLCLESVQWAFSTLHAEFYHPLTWLSLMLDTDLYGVNPAGYLSSNLMLARFELTAPVGRFCENDPSAACEFFCGPAVCHSSVAHRIGCLDC